MEQPCYLYLYQENAAGRRAFGAHSCGAECRLLGIADDTMKC